MKYVIGLDVGIASIGWSVINLDKKRIENLGVRLFQAAEKPKDGGPINAARREARSLRRRIKRRRIRMAKIKELFFKYNLLSFNDISSLYNLNDSDIDTWQLRSEGLDRELNNREWCRVLTSIAKRRGYKSNRKIDEHNKEDGVILKSIAHNKQMMMQKGYRTIGEMFAKDKMYSNSKRNKAGEYTNCIERSLLREEVEILFSKQRDFGNKYCSQEFEEEYLQIFDYQKNFMTPELMEKMIGKCTLEKDEARAAKNSYTFEKFMLLQKINSLSYQIEGEKFFLTDEQKETIKDLAYNIKMVKYEQIKKKLNLPENAFFVGLDYTSHSKKNNISQSVDEQKNSVEKTTFVSLNGYHDIKSCFKDVNKENEFNNIVNKKAIIGKNNENYVLDEIAEIFARNKTDIEIREELIKLNFSAEVIDKLISKINFTKFGHLSYKCIIKLIPFLEEGMQYSEACTNAGYNFKSDDANPKFKLPVISKEEIRNPVVYRAVTQTRKVINSIIDTYGSPFEIHIEVLRELSKNWNERKKIQDVQNKNRNANEELKKELENEFHINVKPIDMLKKRLYEEQEGKSAYSQKLIEYERLFEDGYVEIDHAIPFSRSFDDSYNNKVLVLSRENQEKRNMTPYEYLGGNAEAWNNFEVFVKTVYRNPRKKEILLMKNFNDEKSNEWIARNLNDTKYIARFLSNFIRSNLLFNDFGEWQNRIKVKTINGAATTALRHYWGIKSKDREANDLHHAEDAVIIACATKSFQNKICEYSKQKELYYPNKNGEYFNPETGEIVDVKYKEHSMVRPWENFKEELEARMSKNPAYDIANGNFTNYDDIEPSEIKPIFVSRMPNRKVYGQAHEETIYSKKHKEYINNIVTVKKDLNRISQKEIETIITNEGCKSLYLSNKDMYDRIYERLIEYDFKAEKAFPFDYKFRKYSKNGEGPIIRSVKVPTIMSSGVDVQNGIAANGGMVRLDVFTKNNKFYIVPIYVADMVSDIIPNKAIVAYKNMNEWLDMDNTYEFQFSIHSNDLLKIKRKNENEFMCYYETMSRTTGAINVITHDGSQSIKQIGVQNLEIFEKYEVDVLGNYHKIKKERRQGTIYQKQ